MESCAGLVEHLHQSVALVLGDVASPDVLHPGPGESRLVGAARHLGGYLDSEFEQPLDGAAGLLAEHPDGAGPDPPAVQIHVVLEHAERRVVDAEAALDAGGRGGQQPGGELGGSADLVLGLQQQYACARLGGRDGGCQAGCCLRRPR